MDWNKVGAIGSLVGGFFGGLLFFVTIWPWPQLKAGKAKGGDTNGKSAIPRLIAVSIVGSLLLAAFAIYRTWHPAEFIFDETAKLERVTDKSFQNEEVMIDGHEYENCTFRNVTFRYNGTTLPNFSHNHIVGGQWFVTSNQSIGYAFAFAQQVGMIPAEIPMLGKDRKKMAEPPTPE